jgi:excisionase family DNA binding protein
MSTHQNESTPITLDEASAYFGGNVTKGTLKIAVRKGRLRVSKLGRRYFTTMADVREYVESRTVKPKAKQPQPVQHPDAARAALLSRLAT